MHEFLHIAKIAAEIIGVTAIIAAIVIGIVILAVVFRFSEDSDSGENPFQ